MIRNLFEKRWFQYASLVFILAILAYYFGYVFKFGYKFQWDVLYTENKSYGEVMGLYLLRGLRLTVQITLISAALALGLGTLLGLARLSSFKPLYWAATAYIEFFRNTPLLVQLFFWYFALPAGLPDAWKEWVFSHEFEFWSATIGLSAYTASFMAEVIRAGIQSIPKGLLEAAYSSGLSYFQALRKVILPIAFRNILPPLGSEFLNNMKNSSLAMVVGVPELCWSAQQVESLTFRGFEATTAATVVYLSLSLAISAVINLVNVRLKVTPVEKRGLLWRIGGLILWPFSVVYMIISLPGRISFASAGGDLRYTGFGAVLHKAALQVWKGLVLLAKGVFLAGLAYVCFLVLKGLIAFKWSVIWDNLSTLLIWRFPHGDPGEILWGLGGLSFSILMAVIAISVSFFIGLAVGLGRISDNVALRIPSTLYIELIRGNPLIMVIFWVYFFLPIFIKTYLNVFWSATIALTVFTGAYLAEIVRGGIQNIPKGQFEAAFSSGLSYFRIMRHVILPQALKQMLPAIVGQFIAIFKDTSLAFVIGVLELTFVAQGLNNRLMVYPFEVYTTIAALYFLGCWSMSRFARKLELRLSRENFRLKM